MAGELSLTRTYGRIFSIVRDEVEPVLFDNVSARTALLFRLKEMGAIVEVGGRPHLRFSIIKELPTTTGYTDLDTITPSRANPFTSAIYEWKQLECPVQISGLDMIKTGESAVVDLLASFIEVAEIALRDGLGGSTVGIFSNATEANLLKVTGLQSMLQTSTTTGLVGQLNRATLSVWRHKSQNVSNLFGTNGLNAMRTLYRQCARFDENIDTIAFNGSYMDNFERALTSTFQVNLPLDIGPGDKKMIDAGFANIRYKGAIVFPDDGVPANFGYFLNVAKYLRLIVRQGRAAEIGDFVKARDVDDLVTHVLWAGNQVMTNLARHGVLLNGDTYV